MKLKHLTKKKPYPALSVYFDGLNDVDRDEIAGMMRGLMCAIEGWHIIAGLTNEYFATSDPVILRFSSVRKAHYFKKCIEIYLDSEVLEHVTIKKHVYKN